jgi:hypothetical protein
MQGHGVKSVSAIYRKKPVGVPNLRRHPERAIFIFTQDLLRDLLFERRWWKMRRIAYIGPDVASQLFGGVGLNVDFFSARTLLRLPGD